MENVKKVLIISDGKPGHLNQSIAFCKIKKLDYDILEIDSNKFLKIVSYFLDFFKIYINLFSIPKLQNNYKAVISTGSTTYYSNKYIAKAFNLKSIAIMLPRGFRLDDFDFIIAQDHDNPPDLSTIISLPVNLSVNIPQSFIQKKEQKSLGIILGGNNSIFTMNAKDIKNQLDQIFQNYPRHLKYITTSRRTPLEVEKLIENYQFDYEIIYSQNPSINPIPDFISICDELFISMDSTSMLSEAKANSNAKLNIIHLHSKKKNTKFHKLVKNIEKIDGRINFEKLLERVDI